jgi:Carbohydrate binding domain
MKRSRLLIRAAMAACALLFTACPVAPNAHAAPRFADRFVWIFGWNLEKDDDLPQITKILQSAGAHQLNGAVVSFGFDTLTKKSPDYFRRLDAISKTCDQNHLDLIPALFSVGYASGVLSFNPNLAEGIPVTDAPFIVHGNQATLAPTDSTLLKNGDFEQFDDNTFKNFDFHDQPGLVTFADTQIRHSGRASLRLQNFTANPYGHGRVMQTISVKPHRSYRLTLWAKSENLAPADAFQIAVYTQADREIAPRKLHLPLTTDWRKLTLLFNSLDNDKLGF